MRKTARPLVTCPTPAVTSPDSAMALSVSDGVRPVKDSVPLLPTMFLRDIVAVPQMKSTDTAPWLNQSPVGTNRRLAVAVLSADVILTYSAVGCSTESRVAVNTTDVSAWVPPNANEKVDPCATNPAIAYATRKVALPEMRAPTEPPIEADASVAVPENDTGPPIDKVPEVPAASTFVAM